jgi:hypothetical protein
MKCRSTATAVPATTELWTRNAQFAPTAAQQNSAGEVNWSITSNGGPMNAKNATLLPEPTESEIQHTAYLLWLENGKPEGRDLENWFAAKELLRHRHAPPVTGKRRARSVPPFVAS